MTDLNLFEALHNCDTVEALHTATTEIVKQLGFEHFIYGVRVNISPVQPYQFVFSGYPKEWRDHYSEAGYENIDPTVQHCLIDRRVIPIVWEARTFSSRPAFQLLDEAKSCGLVNGASFPVQGSRGEAAMLSVATSRNSNEAVEDMSAMMGKTQLLACYLHEAIQRIVLSKGPVPLGQVALTKREKECLLWAAEGKTSWEIGSIINVSERTITFHLQNAAHKMGVTNRQHAISRALSLGLITPLQNKTLFRFPDLP
ncbi:MAG: LuxR family transcriptional regulator [Gallionellaceae bacterium]|nr:LuxR family transcriptional regulator [Gallionellaceae bacterium]